MFVEGVDLSVYVTTVVCGEGGGAGLVCVEGGGGRPVCVCDYSSVCVCGGGGVYLPAMPASV